MSLRDHLLAAQAGAQAPPPPPSLPPSASTAPTSPHDMRVAYASPAQHIDPAIGGSPGEPLSLHDMDDPDGRKGRRELSTSKRAAQNRAAQRAFRQRKEQYIQSLKDQVKEHHALAQNYETVQKENFQLRQYIITLQARLLESHTELPPPPESIDLSRAAPTAVPPPQAPPAQMTSSASLENQLQAAAAAAAAEEQDAQRNMPYGQPLDQKQTGEGA